MLKSVRPGDFDGPVLCFLRGPVLFLVIMGSTNGPEVPFEESIGVPIFHTNGPRRFVLDSGGLK